MNIRAVLLLAFAMAMLRPVVSPAQDEPQPAAKPPSASTPPTLPSRDSRERPGAHASSDDSAPGSRVFMGTVMRAKTGFVLRAGDLEYKLDGHSGLGEYGGKNVKIMGRLDKNTQTLHIDTIETSPKL